MLTNKELMDINGGGLNWSVALILGSIFTLIAGILDGYKRPLPCNK